MSAPGFVEVDSIESATELLSADEGAARIIGGGTGLMLMARTGFLTVETLISLRRVADPELHRIEVGDGRTYIGGQCTLTEVEHHPEVGRALPALVSTLRRLSSVRTRNVATIAGCIVHGDPHMDLPPVLMVMDAVVVVAGRAGRRRVRCTDLYRGYYDVALDADDVVVGLEIPTPPLGAVVAYRKFTGALAEDWAVVGVALRLGRTAGRVSDPAVAICAVESAARRLPDVERALTGVAVEDLDADGMGELAAAEIDPIDDHLGSAWYKRRVLSAETARALRAWKEELSHAQH